MNITRLYDDYGIDYKTEGHKHTRPGWVNTECPFCTGNPGYHLGFEVEKEFYFCWRCGAHGKVETIAELLKIPHVEAFKLIKQYKGTTKGIKVKRSQKKQFIMPVNQPLIERHKRYLEKRGYDPDFLEKEYQLLSTTPYSRIDGINYSHRILVPVNWMTEGLVSFITRDITGKAKEKYKVCPKDREVIEAKHILYGQYQYWTSRAICVEGVTDVWRMGRHAVATLGIKFRAEQVRWLSKLFKRVAVLYDDDPQAIIQANKLVSELKFRGVDSFRVDIKGDPGGLSQEEADYLGKQLIN